MTQEFHISVTPVGNDEYLVRTERVAPGVPLAEEQLVWPVEEWLAQARQLMNDPLLGLLQGDRVAPLNGQGSLQAAEPALSLVELGQQFYSALFHGTLRDSWVTAQGIAQHRREALRLRLGLKGARLPRLPWEVLYGTDIPVERLRQGLGPAPRPLTAGTHVIFSRYQSGARLMEDGAFPSIEADQPLRILMVIAAPTDQQRLELHQEANQLRQELSAPAGNENLAGVPEIQLTILDQPGREQLTQALEQGQYQVLHYAGHSNLGPAGGNLYLVNNRTGLTEILSGDDLAGLLVNNGVRLAVFNSCRGAYTAASDLVNERERNLAEALVSRGIPAVLAMAEQIPDHVALTLTWLFYRNLKQGYPIDLSLSRARQGLISAYGSHQLYWALPILYLHPEFDGYLLLSDRTLEEPADRLLLIPQNYGTFPVLTVDEVPLPATLLHPTLPAGPSDDDLITHAVLSEDESEDWVADLEYGDLDYSDLDYQTDEDYEADADVVADLLKQIAPGESTEATAPPLDLPLPEMPVFGSVGGAITHLNEPVGLTKPEEDHAIQTEVYPAPNSVSPPSRPPRNITQPPGRASSRWFSSRLAGSRRLLLPVAGAMGAVTFALLGYFLLPSLLDTISNFSTPLSSSGDSADPVQRPAPDLARKSAADLKTLALKSFEENQFARGQQAVVALLNQAAIAEAEEALLAVPSSRLDDPGFSFLRGRLAWQAANQGNSNYTIEQARMYWENAVKQAPNSLPYHEALGFAYYAENRPGEAIQVWFKALSIPSGQQATARQTTSSTINIAQSPAPEAVRETLTTQAGIALALWKAAADQPVELQDKYGSKAIEIYKRVLASDPNHFRPEALSKTWLWNQAAIQDWQTLAQAGSK